MTTDTDREVRAVLTERLAAISKRLRQVQTSAAEAEGESLGLLVARLAEVSDQLRQLVEQAREAMIPRPEDA
jgi:hypothetical protein